MNALASRGGIMEVEFLKMLWFSNAEWQRKNAQTLFPGVEP
jgi:hypothetical protein